jgi:hypothetical protein
MKIIRLTRLEFLYVIAQHQRLGLRLVYGQPPAVTQLQATLDPRVQAKRPK